MEKEELIAMLCLQKTQGIGDIIAKKLVGYCGSARAVFKEKSKTLEKIDGIGSYFAKCVANSNHLDLAKKEFEYFQKNNIECISFTDHRYPKSLLHCPDGPLLFFQDGHISFDKYPILSIVGTRQVTSRAIDLVNEIVSDLKSYNPIIVSGFAYGVDIVAHQAAVANNLQTIGVLAHGFDTIYPKAHKKYVSHVMDNGGFITEFWSSEQPLRENFLKRNRIVAGLSQATIVIESAVKGGSLVTAEIANSYNRDVFAVPGRVNDIYSQGCNNLIKQNKAAVLTQASDIIQMLNWDVKPQEPVQRQLFVELNTEEQQIVDFLSVQEKEHIDLIALNTQLPIHKVSTALFNLEMKGVIRPLSGKMFELN